MSVFVSPGSENAKTDTDKNGIGNRPRPSPQVGILHHLGQLRPNYLKNLKSGEKVCSAKLLSLFETDHPRFIPALEVLPIKSYIIAQLTLNYPFISSISKTKSPSEKFALQSCSALRNTQFSLHSTFLRRSYQKLEFCPHLTN